MKKTITPIILIIIYALFFSPSITNAEVDLLVGVGHDRGMYSIERYDGITGAFIETFIEVDVYDYFYDTFFKDINFLGFSSVLPNSEKVYRAKYKVIIKTDKEDYSKISEGTIN